MGIQYATNIRKEKLMLFFKNVHFLRLKKFAVGPERSIWLPHGSLFPHLHRWIVFNF